MGRSFREMRDESCRDMENVGANRKGADKTSNRKGADKTSNWKYDGDSGKGK